MENLGFAATPREFLKKIPGKTAETHEQDRQRMLSELSEKTPHPPKTRSGKKNEPRNSIIPAGCFPKN
ncbi:MAG: hypothetical protein EBT88_09900 [Proteobacteria bacterium]|nr:hypothetical protein [Pseudomonadota bacterium]